MDDLFVNPMLILGSVGVIAIVASAFFTVEQQTAYAIERFGRFVRVATAGLNIKIPFIEKKQGPIGLRLKQLDVEVETKTLDDVFVKIQTSVQFRVLPDKISEAFYTLDDVEGQILAFVFDVVRARVPQIKLDDVFSKKDEIANSVCDELKEVMNAFGYDIIKALVTDINPDAKVKAAMNEINEAQRMRIASMERGEAEKILKVKQAEADAESKILQGKGMAGQRKAIIDGFKESVNDFKKGIEGANTADIMSLILLTQYFDTIKDLSLHGKATTILLPHAPAGLTDLQSQIRDSIIVGNQVNESVKKPKKEPWS